MLALLPRSRAIYLVAHRKQDDETATGFRHTASEVSLLSQTSWDNRAHQCVGAEPATRDPLNEHCPFITTRSSCIHRTKYTSHLLRCQVFILPHLLFLWNENIFSIVKMLYEHFKPLLSGSLLRAASVVEWADSLLATNANWTCLISIASVVKKAHFLEMLAKLLLYRKYIFVS